MTDAPDISPNLSLPFYQTKQNEFEVQHNEALMMLDALAMLSVIDRDLTEPPISPAMGDRYLVPAGAGGGFAGKDHRIAQYDIGGWNFYAPKSGWTCYVQDERMLLAWNGAAWLPALDIESGGGGDGGDMPSELQNMTLLGVCTEADEVNPFAAKLNNVLWMARTEAEGGDGTLRYKMSKESADKTLSLLFQNGYSGRAEIGLTGDDDFHFKVSGDGTNWIEAIRVDRATGKLAFPATGGPREMLSADRTYYVRTDGSDGNDGLGNTSGGAFKTIQKAVDAACALDLSVYGVTISLGAGTYNQPVVLKSYVGAGPIQIVGDETTPSNVVVSTTGKDAMTAIGVLGGWRIRGLKIQTTTSGIGILASAGSRLFLTKINFGPCAGPHMAVTTGASINISDKYSISGGAGYHMYVLTTGQIIVDQTTTTLTGTPAFSGSFAYAASGGIINSGGWTFSGGATGKRYEASFNSIINTGGGGANFFPGNAAGTVTAGGQYA